MILSASRRTDIPCYYSDWFINRLKAGYVITRNPMNNAMISKIPLSTEVIDCIVFWTKDSHNIMDKLPLIDKMGYDYYFQFTLTPYDNLIEKNLRDKQRIEETFIELSKAIGKQRVLWRYDPIILNQTLTIDFHKKQFIRMCEKLSNYTESVTISFVDLYPKLKTELIRDITIAEIDELAHFIGKVSKDYGIIPKACCEKRDLLNFGIQKASCIDIKTVEKICGYSMDIKRDNNQRQGCNCCESIDIGVYNTCLNGCVYCYANYSSAKAEKNNSSHKAEEEILIGNISNGERVKERRVKSNRNGQISLL